MAKAQDKPTFVIDTSSWSLLSQHPARDKIVEIIEKLVAEHRVFCPKQVLDEVKDDDAVYELVKQFSRRFKKNKQKDKPRYWALVGKITHEYPAMSKPRRKKTAADPFVIATAEINGCIVVSDETTAKRQNRKIPGVCKKRNPPVRCITLDELVELEKD